jgi:hypothetical protein
MDKTQSNFKQSKLGMSLQATTPTTNSPPSLETNLKNLNFITCIINFSIDLVIFQAV